MNKILIVEDDNNILQLEKDYLEANDFEVKTATDGKEGLDLALSEDFNLILLDVMLPTMDGMEICEKVRKKCDIPILMVSARRDDLDKIKALGIGADDYVVKPFSPSELVARVVAHINRYNRLTNLTSSNTIIEMDNLKIDKTSHQVFVGEKELVLTNKEFDLLTCLAENPSTVFTKEELFEKIWKYDPMGETSTVTVHVNRIREKLFEVDKEADFIHTIWGRGYRFKSN